MTKLELVEKAAKKLPFSEAIVGRCVEQFLIAIVKSLDEDKTIAIRGFGKFSPAVRQSKTHKNSRTGEEIIVPSKRIVRFKQYFELGEQNGK